MSSLDQLRLTYRHNLAKDICALEEAQAALPSEEAQERLVQVAHRLRGSGASYGFPEITEAAKGLETAAPSEHDMHAAELVSVLRELVLED